MTKGVPKALTMGEGDAGSTVEWQTPEKLFDAMDAEFGPFTLDPATALGFHTSDVILSRDAGKIITLTGTYFGSTDPAFRPAGAWGDHCNGLADEWTGRVWLNHPYGRLDWRWMKKAHDSVRYGDAELVCALVPVKPQMKWWHKYVTSGFAVIRDDFPASTRVYLSNDAGVLATTYINEANSGRGEYGADVYRNIRGRLRFGGAPSSAPFASAIVVWRK